MPCRIFTVKPLVGITAELSSKWTVACCHVETIITKTPGDCVWLPCEIKTLGLKTLSDCKWNDDYRVISKEDWWWVSILGPAGASQRGHECSWFQTRIRDGDRCWDFRWFTKPVPVVDMTSLQLLKHVITTIIARRLNAGSVHVCRNVVY